MPTVQDERDTYTRWGWSWNEATANPVYDSAGGYAVANVDVHNDTEADDVWAYLMAYNRRTGGRDGYLQRAQAWRDWYVANFTSGNPAYDIELSNWGLDHIYGWGLQAWGDQFNDTGARNRALAMMQAVYTYWSTRDNGNWPAAGWEMAWGGMRGTGRNLKLAVEVARATGDAQAIELRDRLIDLWLASNDWEDQYGMYWWGNNAAQENTVLFPGSYAAGWRMVSAFHVGVLADALYEAYLATGRADVRTRLLALARAVAVMGIDPKFQYTASFWGRRPDGTLWHSYSEPQAGGSQTTNWWDFVYTTSLVNTLVIGYKLGAGDGFLSLARHYFNRGTKGDLAANDPNVREVADNVCAHFVDTRFDSSTGNQMLAYNKGELQYTYLIFENGGAPTVSGARTALGDFCAALQPGQWGQFTAHQNAAPVLGQTGGASGMIFGYTDKAVWDTRTGRIIYIGSDHHNAPGTGDARWVQYDEQTNAWSMLADAPWMPTTVGAGAMHGYHHISIDPAGRRILYRQYNGGEHLLDMRTGTWTTLPSARALIGANNAITSAVDYAPWRGTHGLYLYFNMGPNGTPGSLLGWDVATGAWVVLADQTLSTGEYQQVLEVSVKKRVAIMGGGVAAPNAAVHTFDRNGVVTPNRTTAPQQFGVQQSIVTVDPVSGDFFFLWPTAWWRYDPDANAWTQMGGVAPVLAPPNNNAQESVVHGVVACPCPTHGVILFPKFVNDADISIWVYKHAA